MKKTLFALLALSSLAMGETQDVITEVVPKADSTLTNKYTTNTAAWKATGWNGLSSANIKANLELLGITTAGSGNYYYLGDGADDSGQSYKTVDLNTNGTITMTGRQWGAAKDGFYVNVTSVSDLLGGNSFEDVNSLTLTTNVTVSTNADAWYGLYVLNTDNTWIEISSVRSNDLRAASNEGTVDGGKETFSKSLTLTSAQLETLSKDSKLFTIYRNPYIAKETLTVNSLQYTLNVDVPVTPGENVPEPTTATLSLLALAGLAARRRRR